MYNFTGMWGARFPARGHNNSSPAPSSQTCPSIMSIDLPVDHQEPCVQVAHRLSEVHFHRCHNPPHAVEEWLLWHPAYEWRIDVYLLEHFCRSQQALLL